MTITTLSLMTIALFGAALGSFANVLIIRWHASQPITGRSRCPACQKVLRPRHLVPLFSWIMLRGKCADCGTKIHIQYPIVEIAATLLTIVAALRHDPFSDPVSFGFETILFIGLLVPVVMDLRWKELPVEWMCALGAFAAARHLWGADARLLLDLASAVALGVSFFGLQYILSRGAWIGQGDIWFGGLMGAILGTPLLTALGIYCAYLLGGMLALIGLALKRYRLGSRVPFAPALATGTLIAFWHGNTLLARFFSP